MRAVHKIGVVFTLVVNIVGAGICDSVLNTKLRVFARKLIHAAELQE